MNNDLNKREVEGDISLYLFPNIITTLECSKEAVFLLHFVEMLKSSGMNIWMNEKTNKIHIYIYIYIYIYI